VNQTQITSERIDNLPVLIYWLKRMQVDVIIDHALGPGHGNWDGLSYGEVALVYVAYVVMCCTHFLSPLQAWASKHLVSLSQALGKRVREADFTEGGPLRGHDRMAIVLSHIGDRPQPSPAQPLKGPRGLAQPQVAVLGAIERAARPGPSMALRGPLRATFEGVLRATFEQPLRSA